MIRDLGDGLVLSPLVSDDAEELFTLTDRNREHLSYWLPWVPFVREIGDSLEFITGCEAALSKGERTELAVRWNGRIAGVLGTHELHANRVWVSLGYWLGKEYEGKGLMVRSANALVEHLFRDLGFHRVEIRCEPENLRSRAIPERLGFRQEGTLRGNGKIGGRFHDSMVYGMLSHEWNSQVD